MMCFRHKLPRVHANFVQAYCLVSSTVHLEEVFAFRHEPNTLSPSTRELFKKHVFPELIHNNSALGYSH